MKFHAILLLSSLFTISVTAQKRADDIIGTWIVGENKAKIQVYRSGAKYFGKIIWLKEPTKDGRAKVDAKNPDPKKRNTPVIGLVVLRDFVFDDGEWTSGDIYDPSSGNEYSCKITMPNKNTMKVRGYIGISLFGRTEVWKRA
jgi:uncharacterized protein (DUF2147 family)